MPGEDAWVFRIDAAEMEEHQRLPIDQPGAVLPSPYIAMWKVPIGNIIAWVPQDERIRNKYRRKVHPTLVGEHVLVHVDTAVQVAPCTPPIYERTRIWIAAYTQETQVVDA